MTDDQKRAAGLVLLTIWLPKEHKEEFAKFANKLAEERVSRTNIKQSEKPI
ncbi:hypothetical protein [Allohahella sp. A8]|uniref:hypothetical protein n=1 Tax=Allohahella sp. A8 TaxID=3141461 RepID=UPI003A7FCE5C